jgi:hypothetical protein
VGIELPKIEVRFEHLNVAANVSIGERGLPSLPNFVLGALEAALGALHLLPTNKTTLNILNDISGIIKPNRFVYFNLLVGFCKIGLLALDL